MNNSPKAALDYPNLPDDLFIIWSGNEFKWPHASRSTSYMSKVKQHPIKGYALYTMEYRDAQTFSSRKAAEEWFVEDNAKRPHPHSMTISTVAEMKVERGYS